MRILSWRNPESSGINLSSIGVYLRSSAANNVFRPDAGEGRGAGTLARCHVAFGKLGFGINGGADPLVRAGRPRPALSSRNQVLATIEEPARGPAADQGVRPTKYAGVRSWENDVALRHSCRRSWVSGKSRRSRQECLRHVRVMGHYRCEV